MLRTLTMQSCGLKDGRDEQSLQLANACEELQPACATTALVNTRQRFEITSLLASVSYRLLTRQKLPHSSQHSLDVPAKTLLSVSTTVNNGEQGDA